MGDGGFFAIHSRSEKMDSSTRANKELRNFNFVPENQYEYFFTRSIVLLHNVEGIFAIIFRISGYAVMNYHIFNDYVNALCFMQ